jgi:hypothetical protein
MSEHTLCIEVLVCESIAVLDGFEFIQTRLGRLPTSVGAVRFRLFLMVRNGQYFFLIR